MISFPFLPPKTATLSDMKRWKKRLLVTAGTLLFLLLLSMLVIPWQIKSRARDFFVQKTERTLWIDSVFFNPFTLTLSIDGLNLSEPGRPEPFVAFRRLEISLAAKSLLERAMIIDELKLDTPFVTIDFQGKQQFNFSDLLKLGQKEEPQPAADQEQGPFLFSFNNVIIDGGRIDFTDSSLPTPARHHITDLHLAVPFIGNIPYLADRYVTPELRLLLNGSEVRASSELKPFHRSLETATTLLLEGIELPYYAERSPVPLPVRIDHGVLDLQLDLNYRVSSEEKPRLILGGSLAVTDLNVRHPDGLPLFAFDTLIVDLDWGNLFQREFNLRELSLYQPQLYLHRQKDGSIVLPGMLNQPAAGQETKPAAEPPTATLPLVRVDNLLIDGADLHYRDDAAGGFVSRLQPVTFTGKGLSTHSGETGQIELTVRGDRQEQLLASGPVSLNPIRAELTLGMELPQLEGYTPYLDPYLNQAPKGRLSFTAGAHFDRQSGLRLEQGRLQLTRLHIPFDRRDHMRLDSLELTGLELDVKSRQAGLDKVAIGPGFVQVRRLTDGRLSPLLLLREQPKATDEPDRDPDAAPWQLNLKELEVSRVGLLLKDEQLPKQPEIAISRLDLTASNLNWPEAKPARFSLNLRPKGRGRIAAKGSLVHTPLNVKGRIDIRSLPVALANGFIPPDLHLELTSGHLDIGLNLALAQKRGGLVGRITGKSDIAQLTVKDPLTGGELLYWDNLGLDRINIDLAQLAVHIRDVALDGYRAAVLIDKQGRVNLAQLTGDQTGEALSGQTDTRKEEEDSNQGAPRNHPDIRVDNLTLQGGTVHFEDRHLSTPFKATMFDLGGRVTGLASDPAMKADVDLRGRLENHSPLSITGTVNPLAEELFADLAIRFRDIDLTPMSPYSGTFIGYLIAKGKLNLELDYKINEGRIDADNRIIIDQLTLGDRVESEQATSLPVSLAIALLKDRSGVIDLDVPISGRLDDPDFSIAGAVWTIIRNLLIKAATSPFSLLAAMVGGDEDFSSVAFEPGTAVFAAGEIDKLKKLADILGKRPGVTLEISGFIDPQQDPEAYRQAQLKRLVRTEKWRRLEKAGKAPAEPDEVEVSAGEYPDLLTRVYKDADFPRPRNFIGLLKKLPVPEMEKLLLANIKAGPEQMAGLAKERALAVRAELERLNPDIAAQLFLVEPAAVDTPPEKGPGSRVAFAIKTR